MGGGGKRGGAEGETWSEGGRREIGEKAFQKQTTLEVVTTHGWIQEHCCPLC